MMSAPVPDLPEVKRLVARAKAENAVIQTEKANQQLEKVNDIRQADVDRVAEDYAKRSSSFLVGVAGVLVRTGWIQCSL